MVERNISFEINRTWKISIVRQQTSIRSTKRDRKVSNEIGVQLQRSPYSESAGNFSNETGVNRTDRFPRPLFRRTPSLRTKDEKTSRIHRFGRTYWYVKFRFFTARWFVRASLNSKTDPGSDKWYAIIDTDSAD